MKGSETLGEQVAELRDVGLEPDLGLGVRLCGGKTRILLFLRINTYVFWVAPVEIFLKDLYSDLAND